jgi:hypothetical protein
VASAPNDVTRIEISPVASTASARPVTPPPPPVDSDLRITVQQVEALAPAFRRELLLRATTSGDPATALFVDANRFETDRQTEDARKGYYEIIVKYPQSALVPYAYLAFAEIFFAESESDPTKLPLSIQAYQKVLTYPAPENLAYAYSSERLGEAEVRSSEFAKALAGARRALAASVLSPTLPLSDRVAEAARRTLVTAYAPSGSPSSAPSFFRASDPSNASALVVALGDEYSRTGHARELAELYGAALTSKDELLCAGAARVRETYPSKGPVAITALARIEANRRAQCGP